MIAPFSILTSIGPPGLLRTDINPSELGRQLERLRSDCEFVTCVLDGTKMKTLIGAFEEFAKGLRFPDYFGYNGAAFEECLTDLSWLNARGICITVENAHRLLADDTGEIAWLLEVLEDDCKEWSVAIEEGQPWDREAIPFHILFHAAKGAANQLAPEVFALPSLDPKRRSA